MSSNPESAISATLRRHEAYCLYTSHFLSMWNSKLYEYAVIIFVQAAFPGNLIASSIHGIIETITALMFASAIGAWIDWSPSRLRTLLLTILLNRLSVIISCLIWFAILTTENATPKKLLFGGALLLGTVEKASRVANTFSMERDWVPTLASGSSGRAHYDLTHLNTVMRRIDILCKLFAPLAVAPFITAVTPAYSSFGIAALSLLSWGIERWCVKKVHRQQPRLKEPKIRKLDLSTELDETDIGLRHDSSPHTSSKPVFLNPVGKVKGFIRTFIEGLHYFFSTPLWLPAMCMGLLHASVLNFGGTLVTYLLNAGFSLNLVTIAKASGSLFDFGSTLVFPLGVSILTGIGRSTSRGGAKEAQYEMLAADDPAAESQSRESVTKADPRFANLNLAVVKIALRGLCAHFINLIPAIVALFFVDATFQPDQFDDETSKGRSLTAASFTFLAFVSLALLGRWTYDLAITQLSQTLIPPSKRGLFAGTEMQITGCLELMHWASAAIWHSQEDFKWIALASFLAVGVGTAAYWRWTRWWEGREVHNVDED